MSRREHHPSEQTSAPQATAMPLIVQMLDEAARQHLGGQHAAAEALFRAVLALHSDHAQAAYNLGCVLQHQGRLAEAEAAYRHAIAAQPDYVEAFCNLGVALQDERKIDDAIAAYHNAIALRPNFEMAYCNLGVALKAADRLEEAVAAHRRAIALKPNYDAAFANLAAVLIEQGKLEEAVAASRQALAIQPGMVMALFNLGTALKHAGELDAAAAAFRQAIALKPDMAEAHFTLAQTLLLQGDLQAGWPEYEWRWRLKEYAWLGNIHGTFSQPHWTGEPLDGRTILIYAEQGLGDTIQHVRYLPRVVATGGRVVLAVHPPLRRLFADLPDITVVDLDRVPLPAFDVQCPLLSLPLIFGTTIETVPATIPYLHTDPAAAARWRERLGGPPGRLRVGVVWAGNPTQLGDRFRSPRLTAVLPLFDVPDVCFVVLQVGPGRQDLAVHSLPSHVLDLGPEIEDLADTAAIMAGLDLVITSCTAPLHLAGALGIPTWAMIPASPHFVWFRDRADSVWYPSLRLYRQKVYGIDWAEVIERIVLDLAHSTCSRKEQGSAAPLHTSPKMERLEST
jgi:tetratricopeptide (TPR) repeat protein